MTVNGTCAPEFAAVRDEFDRNFAQRAELGAAVHLTIEGETVVDLWGGLADLASGRAWGRDTLTHVWSCTKGATALCAHMLASRGELDLDAPVATYWPEFAKSGKEAVTVAHLLSHQAGLPALRAPLPRGAFYDWTLMTDALAKEEPFWAPGAAHGYHGLTFGFLVGEVVRRVSGRSLGTFFREEVAGPLGIEMYLGLPEDVEPRVAANIPADPTAPGAAVPSMFLTAMADPTSVPALQIGNTGGYMEPFESDSRAAHVAEMGSVGAVSDARSLALLYRPLALGGAYGGVRLVDEGQVALMGRERSHGVDLTMGVTSRFTLGFVKAVMNDHERNPGDRDGIRYSDDAFGHPGIGGSVGFADPVARISFGYVMNRQGLGLGLNPRGQSLIDAVYASLGYRQTGSTWSR
ncbi:serine hydrolase domain-containing protein [Actinomycetes bacterium KLBMP 9759]